MIFAGVGTYFLKARMGHIIDKQTVNYLGEKKGYIAMCLVYLTCFFGMQSYMKQAKIFDLNYMVNPREPNGEMMLSIIMKHFPHKVNHLKLRDLMQEK